LNWKRIRSDFKFGGIKEKQTNRQTVKQKKQNQNKIKDREKNETKERNKQTFVLKFLFESNLKPRNNRV